MKTKISWIDFLKGLSIFAVVLDHLFGVIYTNQEVHLYTEFSVTMFIFLAGVTSIISLERNKLPLKEYQLKRLNGTLIPYVIATIIYTTVNSNYRFDLSLFWDNLIHFNASGPFYFVVFYCQLVLIAPFLYRLLIKKKMYFQFLSLLFIYFISKYMTHYTNINGIYGGGGKLLGGSYLFAFFLGMFLFLLYQRYLENINRFWVLIVGFIFSLFLIYAIYISGWLNLGWTNPPNKQTFLYTLSVLLLGYSIFMIFTKWKFTKKVLSIFTVMGRYSLYIFLYHLLSIFYATKIFDMIKISENGIIKAVWFLSFAIVIPVLIGVITKFCSNFKINKKISKWIVSRPKDGVNI